MISIEFAIEMKTGYNPDPVLWKRSERIRQESTKVMRIRNRWGAFTEDNEARGVLALRIPRLALKLCGRQRKRLSASLM
jgi:hypothetical protein